MFWNNGLTRKNETRLFILATVMLSAMLLPSFPIHPSLPNIRLDEMLLFGIFGLNVLAFMLKGFRFTDQEKEQLRPQKCGLKLVLILFASLLASYIISNIYGVVIRGAGYYGMRDVMELVTFFKHFLVITLVLSIDFRKSQFDFLKTAFLAGLAFLLLLSWGQSLNLLNMNTWLSPYFNQHHWDTLIIGNPARVLGTFDNPNVFGIFTVMILAFLVSRYYFVEFKNAFPLALFVLIGLVIKLEYLTISRTSLFGIAVIFSILSIWAFIYYGKNKKILIRIGALFLLTMVLFLTASDGFFLRLNEGLDFSTSTSFQGHVERWGAAVGSIWESPVFGWGTQKYVMTTVVDNEYALFARRYGFVGLGIYLWFFLQPWVLAIRRFRGKATGAKAVGAKLAGFDLKTWFATAYIALLPAIFIYNFMAGIFYNLQIMTIFAIIMGLVYNAVREES